jgi:hypothetical protein
MDCQNCHRPIPPPEAAAYGGMFCENCSVEWLPSCASLWTWGRQMAQATIELKPKKWANNAE